MKLIPLTATHTKPNTTIYVNPAFIFHLGYNGSGDFCIFSERGNAPIVGDLDHLPEPFSSWPLLVEVERNGNQVPVRVNPAMVIDVSEASASVDIGDPPEIKYPDDMPEFLKSIVAKAIAKTVPVAGTALHASAKSIVAVGSITISVTATVAEAVAILTGQIAHQVRVN